MNEDLKQRYAVALHRAIDNTLGTEPSSDEPVAWMHKTYFQDGLYEEDLFWSKVNENSIPLYTHSAKTLTDEEIKQVWQANLVAMGNDLDFARAILRKAQEK